MSEQGSELEMAEAKFFIADVEGWWDYITLTCSDSIFCAENIYPQQSIAGEGAN